MKPKDLPALIMALASLLTAMAGLVKVLRVEQSEAQTYQAAAETAGDQASEIEELRAKVKALEEKR